jgi:hypothetical protein
MAKQAREQHNEGETVGFGIQEAPRGALLPPYATVDAHLQDKRGNVNT